MNAPDPAFEPEWPMFAKWIDVRAPYALALATVAVREALAGPESDSEEVAGTCQAAGRALALGLRRCGWLAACTPASRYGDDHLVVLVGEWVLDPTVEQFGTGGPWVCKLTDLPNEYYDLVVLSETSFEPTDRELALEIGSWGCGRQEEALLCATGLEHVAAEARDIDRRLTEERIRQYAVDAL